LSSSSYVLSQNILALHVQHQEHINQLWAQAVVEELARSGLRHAVISPGSRSTPLVLALAAHPDIVDHSVVDERSAAFFALGLAMSGTQPVALLCTSGTAAANYFPAVCEADASRVPLLLLTADRPSSLRDSGAPQMMDQMKLYGDRVRWFIDTGLPEADAARLRALRSAICQAHAMTRTAPHGPVHVNLPFRKPLEPASAERPADAVSSALMESGGEAVYGRYDGRPWLRVMSADRGSGALEAIADALLRARRPVILAGPDNSSFARDSGHASALLRMADRHGIPVFAEAASQLRAGSHGANCIPTLDLLLRSTQFRSVFDADLVLQLGGVPTNAAAQRFLEQGSARHFCIASDMARRDAAHTTAMHVYDERGDFISRLSEFLESCPPREVDEAFLRRIRGADAAAREALALRCAALPQPFEGAALHEAARRLPANCAVFVSSSMPIRDVETFVPVLPEGCTLFFNRGVNGIDGIVSTALGVARDRGGRTLLVTGDIAFLHNLNAAAGDGLRDIPLTVLLLNNDGGEIFDMLPVRNFEPAFTRHFLTPHAADFSAACAVFGIGHRIVSGTDELCAALDEAFASSAAHASSGSRLSSDTHASSDSRRSSGMQVIEFRTTIAESGSVRRELLRAIAADIDAACIASDRAASGGAGTAVRVAGERFPLAWRTLAEGEGEAVLLLHGFTRSSASWKQLLPLLSGRRVIGVDLMGHGASPAPDTAAHLEVYRLDHAADELRGIIERLGLGRVHLVGYSLGGRTALHTAVRFPGLPRSLALISANPGLEDETARTLRREEDAELAARIGRIGLERFVDEWTAGPLFAARKAQDFQAWLAERHDRLLRLSRGLQGSLLGSGQGAQLPLWDSLGALDMPVLVAAGEMDGRYAGIAMRMAALLPRAEFLVVPSAGHDLPSERPVEIAEALRALWKR
jgi:2-succinyl-5-enolpyruvyl-6-hydroxy-3-cyclohexene-1-carboxylate synthase